MEESQVEPKILLRLVLNLLDISKSEEGQLVPRRTDVDLDALITEILEVHEVTAHVMEIVLRRNVEVRSIFADVDLLRRVIEKVFERVVVSASRSPSSRSRRTVVRSGSKMRSRALFSA